MCCMAQMFIIVQENRKNMTSAGTQSYISTHSSKVLEQVSCPKRVQREISYCCSHPKVSVAMIWNCWGQKNSCSPTNFAGDFLPEQNLKQRALCFVIRITK